MMRSKDMYEELWDGRLAEKMGPRLRKIYSGDWAELPPRLVALLQALEETGR